jgi:hypothetical protein
VPDANRKLLEVMLVAAYREVNPELSERGAHLCRKLAAGLFARGARVEIGITQPEQTTLIHQSCTPMGHIVWVDRRWNEVMGYRAQAVVGQHLSKFLEPGSFELLRDRVWPELVRFGKVTDVPLIFVSALGAYYNALLLKSEILRDPDGSFQRTFTKVKVKLGGLTTTLSRSITGCLALLSSACQMI